MRTSIILPTTLLLCMGFSTPLLAQDDVYVLTTSEQGSAFLFEKANDSEAKQTYTLEQEATDKGVEFHFTLTDTTIPTDVSYWYANSAILSTSSEEAASDCQGITLYGGDWRSPTVDEVNGAITNLDSDFVAAMHTLGNDSYIARGFIQGGTYLFSNSTNKGKTDTDSASLTGNNPTLCVKD